MPTRKSPSRSIKRRSKSPKVRRSKSPKRSVKRRSVRRSKSPKRVVKRVVKRSVKRSSPKVRRSKSRSPKKSARRSLKMRFTAEKIRIEQIALLGKKLEDLTRQYESLSPESKRRMLKSLSIKAKSLARRIKDVFAVSGFQASYEDILPRWVEDVDVEDVDLTPSRRHTIRR
jgi:hypothetical protein